MFSRVIQLHGGGIAKTEAKLKLDVTFLKVEKLLDAVNLRISGILVYPIFSDYLTPWKRLKGGNMIR